ncbi:carbohydrate ABC transporter permease [Jiangella asiatica]|uniref:Sugar ABC transporter permease n=1 Tax=Jiangella asiatica TaxID=2530372 RepID=A0A4V2Z0H8_9ACTN|nr:sugar ABC transporter permease [Jiangella asiatica]TDE01018.1 sugar ABC transporter permease [Jiangella asiatica]
MTTVTSARPARPVHRASSRPRGRRRGLHNYLFLAPAVVFVAGTVLYPLGFNLVQGFQSVGLAEIVNGGARFVGLDNYRDQFTRGEFWHSFGISLLYTAVAVALSVGGGLGLALLFNLPLRGRDQLRALMLLAWLLPTVVSANVWRWLLDGSHGLVNAALSAVGLIDGDVFWLARPDAALVAVTVATAWTLAPFAMILLLAGLQGIPGTLYEAARIDGARPVQQLRWITLPLLRPVTLATLLLCFIYTFKTFDTVFLMTGGGPGGATQTLPIYAYEQAFTFFDFDVAAVATTVLLAVPVMLSLAYFRSLRGEDRR